MVLVFSFSFDIPKHVLLTCAHTYYGIEPLLLTEMGVKAAYGLKGRKKTKKGKECRADGREGTDGYYWSMAVLVFSVTRCALIVNNGGSSMQLIVYYYSPGRIFTKSAWASHSRCIAATIKGIFPVINLSNSVIPSRNTRHLN